MVVDNSGKVYVVWSETDTSPDDILRSSPYGVLLRTSTNLGEGFSDPEVLYQGLLEVVGNRAFYRGQGNTRIVFGPNDEAYVTWSECGTLGCFRLLYSHRPAGAGSF